MNPGAFSRGGALALVAGGFALFLAMIWLISADADVAGERGNGQAHASANGLNGYAGLVRLVEAQGYTIDRSRSGEGLKTSGLLVMTPPNSADAREIGNILQKRIYLGPTLVIMPKWFARPPSERLPSEARDKFKRGWVILGGGFPSAWPTELPPPYGFEHKSYPDMSTRRGPFDPDAEPPKPAPPAQWSGVGLSGVLPESSMLYAEPSAPHDVLIADAKQRTLAFIVHPGKGTQAEDSTYPVIFLAEPDLANNYGLADPRRAAAALALVDELGSGYDIDHVTFDMTLNGFGASENLLTLAFRPPFLAATLSLLVALLIVGWRAFMRFGPAAAEGAPGVAFGKRQLIANGAGLIVRARRFGLLGAPYAALSARRLAERLGLARPDAQAIDAALARRLPDEEPYTRRAARMEAAERPADLLAAAQSLDDLATKLTQGPK
jgi:hypothetical protein